MKTTIDIKPYELENDDTICGYKVKDICLIAKCMDAAGVTNNDILKFVKTFENAAEMARKEYEEAFRKATIINHIEYPFGGEDDNN